MYSEQGIVYLKLHYSFVYHGTRIRTYTVHIRGICSYTTERVYRLYTFVYHGTRIMFVYAVYVRIRGIRSYTAEHVYHLYMLVYRVYIRIHGIRSYTAACKNMQKYHAYRPASNSCECVSWIWSRCSRAKRSKLFESVAHVVDIMVDVADVVDVTVDIDVDDGIVWMCSECCN